MMLRCVLDGLMLPAHLESEASIDGRTALMAYDGDEGFAVEAIEAMYYEVVLATPSELLALERAGYRLLRRGCDFRMSMGWSDLREKIAWCP